MKKINLLTLLIFFIVIGCSKSDVILLKGESDHWLGKYSAKIDGSKEKGNYIFKYKDGSIENLKGVSVNIKHEPNNEFTFIYTKGKDISIPIKCGVCTSKNVKVTIKWDDRIEEFNLKD